MPHRFIYSLRYSLTILVLTCAAAVAQAPTDLRVALVIGNGAYAGDAALANPTNDAKAMSDTLRGLGFTVVEVRDGGKTQMLDAIAKVQTTLKGRQAVGMLYYAGHGLQLDWRNYMVPVDAKLASAADVPSQTIDVNAVIDAFKGAGNRMNILVLDACRNNPFKGSTASGKGLAQVDAPPGTFLAYATAPGNVAEDGDEKSGNGLYTQYLLQELKKPTAKIEDVFKRVRLNVRKQSEGRQIPWESTSLEDDFFFNDGKVMAAAKLSEKEREAAFNVEKAEWDKIKDSKNANDFYAFLSKYPSGFISEAAQGKLNQLSQAKIIASGAADQATGIVRPNQRLQLGDKFFVVRKDWYTKQETRRWSSSVTAVNDDIADIDGGKTKITTSGATVRFQSGVELNFDPPLNTFPADEFQAGNKWKTRTTMALPFGMKGWIEQEIKVLRREKITNEAGTFDTYVLQMQGWTFQNQFINATYWIEPNFAFPVRLEFQAKNNRGNTLQYYIDEWYQKPERTQRKPS